MIPAALTGVRTREGSEAKISATLIDKRDDSRWQALAKPGKRLEVGDRVRFGTSSRLDATVAEKAEGGVVTLVFDMGGDALHDAISTEGAMPLPPYIAARRAADNQDRFDYQTSFAREEGAVAAPTAGLHFTPSLIEALANAGISSHFVTLHVGPGTFLPVRVEDTDDHKMHGELGAVSEQVAAALNSVKTRGNKVVAVGTTSLRLLESAADQSGTLKPFAGETDIFITPGYRFRFIDRLLTNFHLPRSTLFMLVSAFSGLETMKHAYAHAIDARYRFYSYGDACLLSPKEAS